MELSELCLEGGDLFRHDHFAELGHLIAFVSCVENLIAFLFDVSAKVFLAAGTFETRGRDYFVVAASTIDLGFGLLEARRLFLDHGWI